MLRLLDAAEFRYETVYEPAFQEAFSALHTASSHEGRYSARCNPSAVLFTDGDSTYPFEAVAQWNAEKEVSVNLCCCEFIASIYNAYALA